MNKSENQQNPDYEAEYVSEKNKDFTFLIKPLTKTNQFQVATEITKVFVQQEPIMLTLGFTESDLFPFISIICDKNIEQGIGVVVYEKSNMEFAGALLNEDMFDPTDARKKAAEISEGFRNKDKIMGAAMHSCIAKVMNYYSKPSEKLKKINLKVAGTDLKFQGLGLMSRLTKFVLSEHPLLKNAQVYLTTASNPGTQTAFQRNGFKSINNLIYEEVEVEGRKVYAEMNAILEARKFRPVKELQVMMFEKPEV